MNSRVEQAKPRPASARDAALYAAAVALVVGGIFVYTWFTEWQAPLRVAAVVVGLLAALGVFLLTTKGRDTVSFLAESRFELRKVVWPTRQEATRLTWVVMIVVIIVSLLLAAFDYLIQMAIRALLGT